MRQKFAVNVREIISDDFQYGKHYVKAETLTCKEESNDIKYQPIRDIESDEEVVKAVPHVRREKNPNAGKISNQPKRPDNNGEKTHNKGELEDK